MESDENVIQSENNTTNFTNNNSIQLNGTNTIDDKKDNDLQRNTDILKPNVFDLIGGNKNCDTVSSDCSKKKTILNNNNDVAIGFVDDDDDVETNGDKIDAATNCNSDEATKGHENGLFYHYLFGVRFRVLVKVQSTT